MSIVKQYYHVILQSGDGEIRRWQVTNNYFKRRMEVINREMQAAIRQHDKDNQFSMEDPVDDIAAEEAMEAEFFERKYQVTLLHLETNVTHRETFLATDRYAAVAKAFKYFAHKPQAECLDTWKVYDATELKE